MTLAWLLTGETQSIQYRETGPTPFYADDAALYYGTDTASFYVSAPAYATWPGAVTAKNQEYQFKVSTTSGAVSGLLSAFAMSIDVPDKVQALNGIAIGAGGTRLASSGFSVIENVQITLQGGSTATYVEITDKSATLGPLITAKNSAGTSVTATIDAFLQGY
jgi:hypothetical protein